MADKSISIYKSSINNEKQGWYSSSGSKTGSGSTFSATLKTKSYCDDGFFKTNRITKIKITLNCSGGRDAKKCFRISLSGGSNPRYIGDYYTSSPAYGGKDASFTITKQADLISFEEWINGGGTVIKSVDRDSGSYTKVGSNGATCSPQYVKISNVYLTIEYAARADTFDFSGENEPEYYSIGGSYDFKINSNSSDNYHKAYLQYSKVENNNEETITTDYKAEEYLLKEEKETETYEDNFSLKLTDKIKMKTEENEQSIILYEFFPTDEKTFQCSIILETYNKDDELLGESSKVITVLIPENEDTIPKIKKEEPVPVLKYYRNDKEIVKDSSNGIFILGDDEFYINFSLGINTYYATADLSALIELNGVQQSCILQEDGGTYSLKEKKQIFNSGLTEIKIIVKDSRGYYSTPVSLGNIYINKREVPIINSIQVERCTKDGEAAPDSGIYCKVNAILEEIVPVYDYLGNKTESKPKLTLTYGGATLYLGDTGILYKDQDKKTLCEFSTDSEHIIEFTYTNEILGTEALIQATLPSAAYLLHFREGQTSIGIGCGAEDIGSSQIKGLLKIGVPVKGLQLFSATNMQTILDLSDVESLQGIQNKLGLNFVSEGLLKSEENSFTVGDPNHHLYFSSITRPKYNGQKILISDDIFYKEEETIIFKSEYITGGAELLHGYISDEKKIMMFKMILPKRLDNITAIRIDSLKGNIRSVGGTYASGKYEANGHNYIRNLVKQDLIAGTTSNPSRIIRDLKDGTSNSFIFTLQSAETSDSTMVNSTFNITNNTPVSFMINEMIITFTNSPITIYTDEEKEIYTTDTVIIDESPKVLDLPYYTSDGQMIQDKDGVPIEVKKVLS